MNFCTTRPPNSENLRDDIVRNVNQRVRVAYAASADAVSTGPNATDETEVKKRKREYAIDTSSFRSARRDQEELVNSSRTSSNAEYFVALMLKEQAKQRLLRRDRQRGYRQRQNDLLLSLKNETLQLRDEIQTLEKRRSAVISVTPIQECLWGVVVEYFHVFRFGVRSTAMNFLEASAQLKFLERTMTLDVVTNSGFGPKALLASWSRLSTSLQGIEVELLNAKRESENSLVATITTALTMTQHTLKTQFPHLCHSSSSLEKKLLHQEIVMPGTVQFTWDSTCGRITSALGRSDMLAPILQLVGSVDDLSRVFEYSAVLG
ncbi:hypothetical protein GN244_ATG18831 [Phytophthora infestans]|uniref:Bzip transcription factor n=1 Tax=Phytophthora infestans TaxID=4787 RepID=A0A833S818_PHYIN|nr:hypothetical protein GN244_ATG18831 [Phytophthora infestans]KAF4138578.1 hypothetical protein GN958_ATG12226 [Phytophthora infestans]